MSKRKRRNWPPPTLAQRIGLRVLIALLLIVVLAFLAGLAIALVIAGPILLVVDWVRKRDFIWRHTGQAFLVPQRRHGWYDFILNNVKPALPPRAVCLWIDGAEPLPDVEFYINWRIRRPRKLRRPYLVVISQERRLRIVPLHEALLPLKPHAKKSLATQQAVAEVIRKSIELTDK